MEDEVHKGYKWQSKAGRVITGPLRQVKTSSTWTQSPHNVRYRAKNSLGVLTRDTQYTTPLPWDYRASVLLPQAPEGSQTWSTAKTYVDSRVAPLFTTNELLGLATSASADASESAVLLAVTLAEAKKTMAMVPELIQFAHSMKLFMTRNGRKNLLTRWGAWQMSKAASGQWLAIQYGLRPLIGECRGFLDIMQGKWPAYVRRRKSLTRMYTTPYVQADGMDEAYRTFSSAQWTRTERISAGCYVKLEAGEELINQLGLLSPLSTAWELVPYSCIIDYVLKLSDTFAYLDGRLSGKIIGLYQTRRTVLTGTYAYSRRARDPYTVNGTTYWGEGDVNATGTQITTLVERLNATSITPVPSLRLPNLGWEQWANVAAVWRQLLQ